MKRMAWVMMMAAGLAACDEDTIFVPVDGPAAPVDVFAVYYAGTVTVSWELGAAWNGEAFRVYSRRVTDADFFLIAEVTSCANALCVYEDRNIVAGERYEYYVAAVDPDTGVETASEFSVEVDVPFPEPPPVPTGLEVVALDGTNYLRWSATSRDADDFSFYRVYQDAGDGVEFILGETDSEGFLDRLAVNGGTYRYFVTAVDDMGHESGASSSAEGTPRPDYHGEWLFAFSDVPQESGFRFREDENDVPIVSGTSAERHFRLEVDGAGWWLVPGPGTDVHAQAFETTALRCGPAADASCMDVPVAPATGYSGQDVELFAQTSYVLRVRGDDGRTHYGVIRVQLLGFDQNGAALAIFDWAYQTQPENPNLAAAR